MPINYDLTQEDLVNFYLFHIQFDQRAKRAQLLQSILGCICIGLLTLVLLKNSSLDRYAVLALAFVLMLFFFAFYRVIFRSMIKKRVVALIKKEEDIYEGHRSMLFTEDRLIETTEDKNLDLPYKDVYRARENKDYFYIYSSPDQAYIIPKRCLSIKASEELRRLLKI